jgi:hypothetical protein
MRKIPLMLVAVCAVMAAAFPLVSSASTAAAIQAVTWGVPEFFMGQPPSRSCVCDDNKTGGGCGCQDRGAQVGDPVRSVVMGLPPGPELRTKGQLAVDISADALTDGINFDFFCGDAGMIPFTVA